MDKIQCSPYSTIFWNEFRLDPKSCAYNVIADHTIRGPLDVNRLANALDSFIADHILFDSHLTEEDDGSIHWVKNSEPGKLQYFRGGGGQADFVKHPFDVERGPLYRIGVFEVRPGEHELLIVMHHLIIDGVSGVQLVDGISARYNRTDYPKPRDSVEIALANEKITRDCEALHDAGAGKFWRGLRPAFTQINALATQPRRDSDTRSVQIEHFSLDKTELKSWRPDRPLRHATPFQLFISAWGALLARYRNCDAVPISFPVAIAAGHDFSMGAHVNVAVLPMTSIPNRTFRQLYQHSLQFFRDARSSDGARFIEWPTHLIARASGATNFDTGFVQTNLRDSLYRFDGCDTQANQRYFDDMGAASLLLEYCEHASRFDFRLRALGESSSPGQARQYARDFRFFLRQLVLQPDAPIGSLPFTEEQSPRPLAAPTHPETPHEQSVDTTADEEPAILSRAERDQLLRQWNPLPCSLPNHGLAERFESMVERHPARIALADETRQYDYRTLNRRANQLAHHLRQQYPQWSGSPIEPDTRIAVCMTRSLDALVALLAVVKAGAAYVPMDAKAPAQRQRYILEDSGSRLVLTEPDLLAGLQSCAPDVTSIVFDAHCALAAAEDNPGIYRAPHDLAQVIYTSGTTGKPKGVLIEQGSIIGLLVGSETLRISEHDALLQMANLAFDAATMELWGALLNGAKLALSTQPEQLCSDARRFEAFVRHQQVSIGFITRSLFDHMYLSCPTQFGGFRCLLVGGEALTPDIMRGLASQTQRPASILNAYGPTECTVFATTYPIENVEATGSIPIGRALSQRTCYVLDGQRRLLPRGAIGELYIGGQGVARGYLNLSALTAERFVSDPFASDGNQRMYRTGDLVRWRPDGQLEYIGRNDFQVKIRGYRVEPAEIEARLLMHTGIRQCAVTVLEREGQSGRRHELLAWYVAATPLNADDLRAWLSLKLPEYMIPAHFIPLNALPLTANGKLDRKALLTLEPQATQSPLVAPRSPLEQILHDVWCDVLDITELSVDDDFYRVGGDSILSILLTTKLRKHHLACPVRAIFEQRTIARLAAWLQNQPPEEDRISEQGALSGPFALLPVQRWFAARRPPQPHHWNQACTLSIPPLERSMVEKLVAALHARHDMLRTTFRLEAGLIVAQTYQPTLAAPPVTELDAAMDRQALEHRLTQLQSHFDLTHGPLWCVAWIRNDSLAGPQHLFIAAHHLVIDAVSWRIIRDDLKTLCEGGSLDQKGSSYRQWVDATARYAARHPAQLAWWQTQMTAQPDYWQWPGIAGRHEVVAIELDARQTGRLLKETATAFHTGIDDLLLSALAIALHHWHGQTESWLTLEGHGREEIDSRLDVRRTVGWFTCLYPVKLAVKDTLAATIRHVKECLRAIPDKGIGYGAFRYGAADAAHANALDTQSLPAISFNYLGQFSSSESTGEWQLAAQGCGIQIAPDNDAGHLIDMTGGVFEHRLRLTLKTRLHHDVAEKLAGDFTLALHEIIDLCTHLTSRQRSLFTPSDFPHATIALAELDRLQHRHALDNVYRATGGQRELMYFNRVDPDFQIDQVVMEIEGTFDPQRMASAWTHVMSQHDILRAGFTDRNNLGNPQLFVCKQVPLPIQFADWRALDCEAEHRALSEAILQQRNEPFDFEQPPLFRLLMATARNERHILIHTCNHILFDGWSLNIILTEIVAAYAALHQGRPPVACSRSFMPFPAYLSRDGNPGEAQAFWASYLQGAPRNQRLPIDTTETVDTRRALRMRCVASTLTRQLNDALYEFGKAQGYTANQLTQLAWIRVLADHLNEDDIAIGTTMSDRPAQIDDVARLVGLFVASPVLRLTKVRQRGTINLLDDLRGTQSDRQQFAFHELTHYDAQWVPEAPFGSLFVFENMPEAELGSEPPFRLKPLNAISGSNHQTVLCLIPHAEGLELRLFYDARELREETATRLLARFTANLNDMVSAPLDSAPVRDTRLAPKEP